MDNEKNNLMHKLDTSIDDASEIITKSYLDKLDEFKIVKPSAQDMDIDIPNFARIYEVSKLVYSKEENYLDKLTTIVNVAFSVGNSIAIIIKGNKSFTKYYIGTINKSYVSGSALDNKRNNAAGEAFGGAILGNLIGSRLKKLDKDEISNLQNTIFCDDNKSVAAISGLVSLRNKDNKDMINYVQGIENLSDSLTGKDYTVVLIADPVKNSELKVIKEGYEILYSQLSSFTNTVMTINENENYSMSKSQSEGISNSISEGIAMTQSSTKSFSESKFSSKNIGVSANALGFMGIHGGFGAGNSDAKTDSDTLGKTDTKMRASQTSNTSSETETSGTGRGRSLQINYSNKRIETLLEKIDKHLERLDMCESFGAFNCAAYVIGDSNENTLGVCANYNAIMRGDQSFVQASGINLWDDREDVKILSKYIKYFTHPKFEKKSHNEDYKSINVTPASIISGTEMAMQMSLPKRSINGIPVIEMYPFGRNIISSKEGIDIGNLFHMGQVDETKISIDLQSLASHTFITGSTGTGKSNVIYSILDKMIEKNIKFLVIEPAKGEYKNIFGGMKDVYVYGSNPNKTQMLKVNPFSFPEDIHVLEHIDRLIEIFNACWPMYAAMPAILKEAIEKVYIKKGWSLRKSFCNPRIFPDFEDLMNVLPEIIMESSYSSDTKGDYIGALVTRVRSMTKGINGQIFCSVDDIQDERLFDSNVIIDISRIGSMETKSLIMGILVMKLQEYRMSSARMNSDLKHVTILEEAHNLLRSTSFNQNQESANLQGKSVEMISNAIAEMRTYGEGFIIADQAPGLMDMSAIRNTNTKIILRLPDESDRNLVGKSAALNDGQISELSRLEKGVAAIYQNEWIEPVLCKFLKYENELPYVYNSSNIDDEVLIEKLLRKIVIEESQKIELLHEEVKYLKTYIDSLNIGKNTKAILNKLINKDKISNRERQIVLYNMFHGKNIADKFMKEIDSKALNSVDEYISNLYNIEDESIVQHIRDTILLHISELYIGEDFRIKLNSCIR